MLKKLIKRKNKGAKKELMKNIYSKLKKLIRSKNNLKKCELKAKETEKKKIKGMKRIENEPLLNPKEAEKKQIQRNQENKRTKKELRMSLY